MRCKSQRDMGSLAGRGEGEEQLKSHTTTLTLQVNLQDSKPGLYLLAVRLKGWELTYYLLVLK